MERLTSRKNPLITHLRRLGADRAYRRECGEFLCDGEKLLNEALRWNADITAVLWNGEPGDVPGCPTQARVDKALLDYVSPLRSSASVLFSARCREWDAEKPGKTLVLETIQDPGNLGTILRTANALRINTVILTGDCADVYNPKTVRAGMGAVFRQRFLEMELPRLSAYLRDNGLRLIGAALSEQSEDLRSVDLNAGAIAIGSEGRGLSERLLEMCDGQLIIPMNPQCESLNAAVAAAIIMWEMSKGIWNAGSGSPAFNACASVRDRRCWTAMEAQKSCGFPIRGRSRRWEGSFPRSAARCWSGTRAARSASSAAARSRASASSPIKTPPIPSGYAASPTHPMLSTFSGICRLWIRCR